MTIDQNELMERLLGCVARHPDGSFIADIDAVAFEAASAIVSLQAQVDALIEERTNIIATKREQIATVTASAKAAEAEVTRLRAQVKGLEDALRPFAEARTIDDVILMGDAEIARARAALTKGGTNG